MSDKLLDNLKDTNTLETVCSINTDGNDGICLPINTISKLNNVIVDDNTVNDICEKNDIKCIKNNKEEIISSIAANFGCSNDNNREICIINKTEENRILDSNEVNKIKFNHFKPYASKNPIDWLSNDDIDMVQEQLYKKYNGYYYSNIHMIDLVMVDHSNSQLINHPIKNIKDIDFYKELNNIDYNNKITIEPNKLKSYGIVCNTDPSTKGGQHWFSIYINFNSSGTLQDPYTIEYFNSSGGPLYSKKFKEFFLNLENDLTNKLQKCVKFIQVTNIQHQGLEPGLGDKSGNCGCYSLYYIWSRLQNIPYQEFNKKKMILSDNIITEFREKLFRDVE
jgi:hypothetical protein